MKTGLLGIVIVILSVPVTIAASWRIGIVSSEGEQVGQYQANVGRATRAVCGANSPGKAQLR